MISLRAPEQSDIDLLYLWENDPGLFESLPHPAPLSRYQIWQYIENYQSDPFATHELRMMISHNDTTAGHIDIFEFSPADRRAGIGIYIDSRHRRQGIATQALQQLEQYATTNLGIHQLWATIAIDNTASISLFTNAGYRSAGRLRSWIRRNRQYTDALIFQKIFP